MAQNIKSYDELIADIKFNYEYHLNEANRLGKLLGLIPTQDVVSVTSPLNGNHIGHAIKNNGREVAKNGTKTFEDEMIDILQDGIPRTVRQLSEELSKRTKRKYDRKEFSSKLATIKKLKKTIRNIEYRDLPVENRYWWGLESWYRGENLKPEYKEKIYKNLGLPLQHSILQN